MKDDIIKGDIMGDKINPCRDCLIRKVCKNICLEYYTWTSYGMKQRRVDEYAKR